MRRLPATLAFDYMPVNRYASRAAWIADGGGRVRLAKSIPPVPRLRLGGEVRCAAYGDWEERVHLDYRANKNTSIIGQWHSVFGWCAGPRGRF